MKILLSDLSCFSSKELKEHLFLLSEEERERVRRIKTQKTQSQFILGRIILRKALSEELQCQPSEIKIKTTPSGRLELDKPHSPLSFNLSHSKDRVAFALSNHRIGVDIEYIRARKIMGIAERFFSPQEVALLNGCETFKEKEKQFYIYWTLKEAWIKCNGEGVFSISPSLDIAKIQDHQFFSYQADENYILSLALQSTTPQHISIYKYIAFQKKIETSLPSLLTT